MCVDAGALRDRGPPNPHPPAPPFRTRARKQPIEGLAEALVEGIFVGHPGLPEFVFEADEAGAIFGCLETIQERG